MWPDWHRSVFHRNTRSVCRRSPETRGIASIGRHRQRRIFRKYCPDHMCATPHRTRVASACLPRFAIQAAKAAATVTLAGSGINFLKASVCQTSEFPATHWLPAEPARCFSWSTRGRAVRGRRRASRDFGQLRFRDRPRQRLPAGNRFQRQPDVRPVSAAVSRHTMPPLLPALRLRGGSARPVSALPHSLFLTVRQSLRCHADRAQSEGCQNAFDLPMHGREPELDAGPTSSEAYNG